MSDTAPHSCTRLTILLIGAFAAALSACSQPRVTGQVLDGSGKPLSGATVNVENTTFTTITDDAGRYSVEYIPGKVQVSITKQGYTSERLALEIATKATYPAQSVKLYLTLTRESAEALIRPQIGGIATITVEVGRQFRDQPDLIAQHISIFKQRGILAEETSGRLTLTGKAKSFALNIESTPDCEQWATCTATLVVAKRTFGEITGIRESQAGHRADVEFNWRWNPNAAGEALDGATLPLYFGYKRGAVNLAFRDSPHPVIAHCLLHEGRWSCAPPQLPAQTDLFSKDIPYH